MSGINPVSQAYRLAVLTNIDSDGRFRDDKIVGGATTRYVRGESGLTSIQMRMPDNSTEYWQQTEAAHNGASGFRAMAFIRCDAGGNTRLENGAAQVMLAFPGNTNTGADWALSQAIVENQNMTARYHEVESFTYDYADALRARAAKEGWAAPAHITVGTYSQGATGIGAGLVLGDQIPGAHIETVLAEPFGAGKAVEEWAVYRATQQTVRNSDAFKNLSDAELRGLGPEGLQARIDTLPADQKAQITADVQRLARENARALTANTISIRSSQSTVVSALALGDEITDNGMIGKAYYFRTHDNSLSAKFGRNHLVEVMAESLLTQHRNTPLIAGNDGLSGEQVLEKSGILTDFDRLWAKIKTFLLGMASKMGLTSFISEDPDAARKGFEDMEELPALDPLPETKPTPAPGAQPDFLPGLHNS